MTEKESNHTSNKINHNENFDEEKENSHLAKTLRLPSWINFKRLYDLTAKTSGIYYNYKLNRAKKVLNLLQEESYSPIKSELAEQTLYNLLDYREKVSKEHIEEYDRFCEEFARVANLIQPGTSKENFSNGHIKNRRPNDSSTRFNK